MQPNVTQRSKVFIPAVKIFKKWLESDYVLSSVSFKLLINILLQLGPHLSDLWQLFHPKLSEPAVPVHQNKQALLLYWHHACEDCPENIQLVLNNPYIVKNIAFNYIL